MGSISYFVGNVMPYITLVVFLVGFIYRVAVWWSRPSPISIAVFPGQRSVGQSIVRVLTDVIFFRSLLRFKGNYTLWLGSWIFHLSFLILILSHLRYFIGSVAVPGWINAIQELGIIAGIVISVPLIYLLLRRLVNEDIKYISTPADYFIVLLILAVAITGLFTKFIDHPNIVGVKYMIMNLMAFKPVLPEGINSAFILHFFLAQVLIMYLPFSKVMHLGGIFFSPTRTHIFGGEAHTKEIPEE